MTKNKAIFILGMHRSGTSALTGTLKEYGLFLGSNYNRENRFNKKGNHEDKVVNDINQSMMADNGGSWYEPKDVVKISDSSKSAIQRYCSSFSNFDGIWGTKDPRMLFCLAPWKEEVEPDYIGIFRNQKSVVDSLIRRNELQKKKIVGVDWANLWYEYNLRLITYQNELNFPLLNFDWPEEKFIKAVSIVAKLKGLSSEVKSEFFDSALKSKMPIENNIFANGHHEKLYKELCKKSDDWLSKNENENNFDV